MSNVKAAKKALKLTDDFQYAISLLWLHGLMTDGEREKTRQRMDKWATENGLQRKAKP